MFEMFCDGSARELGIEDKKGRVSLRKLNKHTKKCLSCRQQMKRLKVAIQIMAERELFNVKQNKDLPSKRHRSKHLAGP